MARFTMRYGSKRYESLHRAFEHQSVSIIPRSVFSNSMEMPDMTIVESIEDFDSQSDYTSSSTVSESMW